MDICGGRSSPYKRNTPRKNRTGSSNSKMDTFGEIHRGLRTSENNLKMKARKVVEIPV